MLRMRARILAALLAMTGAALAMSGPAAAATAVPGRGLASSLAFTHSRHDQILIAAGVILLLIIVLLLRILRRRRTSADASGAEAHQTFPPSADTWHNADLAREINAPLPSFHQSQVVLPSAAPGWHPVNGDQTKLAYWDGAQWAAYRQWDGTAWVDVPPVRQ